MSNLSEELNKIAEDLKIRLQREARVDGTVASGSFAKGFDVKVTDDSIVITNNTKYANAIINGAGKARKPKPPIDSIIKWAKAKRIRPYIKKGRSGVRFTKITESSYKKMAWAIIKGKSGESGISGKGIIKRFNYSGSNLLNRVYKETEDKIGIKITEAFREDLQTEIRRVLKVE